MASALTCAILAEEVKKEIKEEETTEEEKGALGKLKDAILPDAEEQAAIVSTFVRLEFFVSGGILIVKCVIPGVPQQKLIPHLLLRYLLEF